MAVMDSANSARMTRHGASAAACVLLAAAGAIAAPTETAPDGPAFLPEDAAARAVERCDAVDWLPLGAGQFQNGEVAKGTALAWAELLAAAASVGAFAAIESLRGPTGRFEPDAANVARTLDAVKWITGAAFWLLYAWGVYDAHAGRPVSAGGFTRSAPAPHCEGPCAPYRHAVPAVGDPAVGRT